MSLIRSTDQHFPRGFSIKIEDRTQKRNFVSKRRTSFVYNLSAHDTDEPSICWKNRERRGKHAVLYVKICGHSRKKITSRIRNTSVRVGCDAINRPCVSVALNWPMGTLLKIFHVYFRQLSIFYEWHLRTNPRVLFSTVWEGDGKDLWEFPGVSIAETKSRIQTNINLFST